MSSSIDSYSGYDHFFHVQIELFDGPIDLLLHLVKQRELPIEKVSLAQVTQQYLHCLNSMRQVDLEIAGEYLVIAATLVSIKAAVMLAEPVELVPDEEGNLIDPHEELLRRLREAEVFKEGASILENRDFFGLDVFSPPSSLKHVPAGPVTFKQHDPMLLGRAFRKLLENVPESESYTVTLEAVSVIERMMAVIDVLKQAGAPVSFLKVIPDITSRAVIVGTFIALLELCKRQIVVVQQEDSFDEITVSLAAEDADVSSISSEFDFEATANG